MTDSFKIEQLRRAIVEVAQDEEEIPLLINELLNSNWATLFAEKQVFLSIKQEQEEERRKVYDITGKVLYSCGLCKKRFPQSQLELPYPRHLKRPQRRVPERDNIYCCKECCKSILEKYINVCKICNEKFIANNSQKTCLMCWYKDDENLKRQVQSQVSRARKNGTPATLTVSEWKSTVYHFKGLCAYCHVSPMEALDHFIPVTCGGGTTVNNCVPICSSCNNNKKNNIPDEPKHLYHFIHSSGGVKRLEEVKMFLQAQKNTQVPTLLDIWKSASVALIVPSKYKYAYENKRFRQQTHIAYPDNLKQVLCGHNINDDDWKIHDYQTEDFDIQAFLLKACNIEYSDGLCEDCIKKFQLNKPSRKLLRKKNRKW